MRLTKSALRVMGGAAFLAAMPLAPLHASSHMDAPLITLDDPANTTDVYAFVSESPDGQAQYLTTALAVYPFEEPGIGPNIYRFDDRVRYEIHVATNEADLASGRATVSYRFEFKTRFQNPNTILQAFQGVIGEDLDGDGFSPSQNLRQTYTVTKVDHRTGYKTVIGSGLRVPPNNQGFVTPLYNQNNDGDMPAKEGVNDNGALDFYTRTAIGNLSGGYQVFAGQRDDGFYADIQSIFDLDFAFGGADPLNPSPAKPFDSQGGFNVHTIVLNIPFAELGEAQIAGVYATTSRRQKTKLAKRPARNVKRPRYDDDGDDDDDSGDDSRGMKFERNSGRYIQVARQGNPLFNEALVQIARKDLYNRVGPDRDEEFFLSFAANPDLASPGVLNTTPLNDANGNSLIVGIYIPDLIKVDLTTGPARLAGEAGFNRLGLFGGDVLQSSVQDPFGNGGLIPGGWPNGRRFGDDVDDIALLALGVPPLVRGQPVVPEGDTAQADFDGITSNDITFNDVFPYAATPLNGRNHGHHGDPAKTGDE